MTSYTAVKLSLHESQKQKIAKALQNPTKVTIQITPNQIDGDDVLPLTKTQINKLQKGKTANITLSQAQIRKIKSSVSSRQF